MTRGRWIGWTLGAAALAAVTFVGVGQRTASARGAATVTCGLKDSPSGEETGRWKTIGRAKGRLSQLPQVREDWYGCVAGGLVRGIAHANGGLPTGMSADDLYKDLLGAMKKDPKIAWKPGKKKADGTWIPGGGAGGANEFKDLKDQIVLKLISEGKLNNIKTTAVTSGGSGAPQDAFLRQLAAALNSGKTVEVDIGFGNTGTGHFAFLVEVVERGGDIGFIIADDRQQGDQTATTKTRGPFFVTKSGGCYYLDKTTGATKQCKNKNWIRGALIQSR